MKMEGRREKMQHERKPKLFYFFLPPWQMNVKKWSISAKKPFSSLKLFLGNHSRATFNAIPPTLLVLEVKTCKDQENTTFF